MEKEQAERKLTEIHEYVRHLFYLYLTWFTFFVTINYLAMGWLAKDVPPQNKIPQFVWVIPAVLILQNVLGLIGSGVVWKRLSDYDKWVLNIEKAIDSDRAKSSVPMDLYTWVISLIAITIIGLIVAWSVIWKWI